MFQTDDVRKSIFKGLSKSYSVYVAICIVVVGLVLLMMLGIIKKQIDRNLIQTLQTVMYTTKGTISSWIDEKFNYAMIYAQSHEVQTAAKNVFESLDRGNYLLGDPALVDLQKFLHPLLEKHGMNGVFIFAPDGTPIVSMSDTEIDEITNLARHTDFLQKSLAGENDIILPFESDLALTNLQGKLTTGESAMFILVPVFDEVRKVIATFALQLDPSGCLSHIVRMARSGKTGDFYVFNKQGFQLTAGRFNEQLPSLVMPEESTRVNSKFRLVDPGGNLSGGFIPRVSRKNMPLTRLVESATAGETGIDLSGYRGYRGVPVVGTWVWDESNGLGFAYEIDAAEAFLSYYTVKKASLAGFLFISVLLIMGSSFLERKKKEFNIINRILAENETKFRTITNSIGDAIILVDSTGQVQFWSNSAEKLFGYSASEAIGASLHDLIVPERLRERACEEWQKYQRTGELSLFSGTCEFLAQDYKGQEIPVELAVNPINIHDQLWAVGAIRDITDRKTADERLRRSESLLKQAQHIAKLGSWELDIESGELQWSDAVYYIFNLHPQEVEPTYELFLEMIHPDDRELVSEAYQHSIATRSDYNIEHRLLMKNGSIKYVNEQGSTSYDAGGRPITSVGIVQDITQRIVREQELQKLSERLRLATDAAGVGVWDWDLKTNELIWDESLFRLYGISPDDFSGDYEAWEKCVHPEDLERVALELQQAATGEKSFNSIFQIVKLNGDVHHIKANGTTFQDSSGEPVRMIGTNFDITERIQKEEQLQRASERLQLATDTANVGIWDWQIKSNTVIWDESMRDLYGLKKDECINDYEGWEKFVHPDDKDLLLKILSDSLKDQTDFNTVFRIIRQNGAIRYLRAAGRVIREKSTKALRMIGTNYDITENIEKELELQTLSERLQLATRSAGVGIWDWNVQRDTLFWSDSMFEIYGIDKHGFSGKHAAWKEMVHQDDRQKANENIEAALQGIQEFDTRLRIVRADNEVLHIRAKAKVHRDESDNPIRMMGVNYDVSKIVHAEEALRVFNEELESRIEERTVELERSRKEAIRLMQDANLAKKQAEDTLQELKKSQVELLKLSSAVEASPVSVVVVGTTGIIEYVNRKFTEITGYCSGEVIGSQSNIFKDGSMSGSLNKGLWQTIMAGAEWHSEFCNRKKDGTVFWEQVFISPIFDSTGNITHYVEVKEDITAKKLADEALQDALVRAEEATRAKSEFLANMSHEIRTPMNAIIGMSHLALQTDLDLKQKQYVNVINTSAKSLLSIINDILDFSKIEAGKLAIEQITFNLSEALENVISIVARGFAEKGVELLVRLDKTIPDALIGDPVRIGQVFSNLLDNASKFTPKGEVGLYVNMISQENRHVILECTVTDTGIGMTEDQAKMLFQKFSQADTSTTRKYGGTGLGLAITKQLIELMGGEIYVETSIGKGSKFTFTLHLQYIPDRRKDQSPLLLPLNLRNLRVLIVENNRRNQHILTEQLKSLSFNVQTDVDITELFLSMEMENSRECSCDLALLDFRSIENGDLQLIGEKIGTSLGLTKIPLIIMATVKDVYAVEKFIKSHEFVSLLLKPVTSSALFNAIVESFGYNDLCIKKRWELEKNTDERSLPFFNSANILLVEDNLINQQVAIELLDQVGSRITVANNGREAVKFLQKLSYDLVLMDIQMPEMDGFTATAKIREMQSGEEETPIIAMTANAMVGDRERSLEAGMNDHISKPIEPELLYKCLLRWLRPKEGDRSIRSIPDRQSEILGEAQVVSGNEQSISLPSSIAGIDIKTGLRRVGENPAVYLKLLRGYRKDNSNFSENIKNVLYAGDTTTALRLVHTLKGISGSIGALAVEKYARLLEKSIKEQTDERQVLLDATLNSLQEVLTSIENTLSNEPEAEERGQSISKDDVELDNLIPRLVKLRELLEISDMDAEAMFIEIEKTLSILNLEQTENIANALECLDFPRALKLVEEFESEIS